MIKPKYCPISGNKLDGAIFSCKVQSCFAKCPINWYQIQAEYGPCPMKAGTPIPCKDCGFNTKCPMR